MNLREPMPHSRVRSLAALLREAGITTTDAIAGDEVRVSGIATDSRAVLPGELFVAITGTRSNGAAFVEQALAAGASAVVSNDLTARTAAANRVPVIIVPDARAALAQLASAFHAHPQRELLLIGVTGTLGKTSTVALLETVLVASDPVRSVGVVGSLGAHVYGPALGRLPPNAFADMRGMTTPDATVLYSTLRTMADAGVDVVAMEVTSHALAQHRVDGLEFALGVFTNLVPDEHLEYHHSPDEYVATKARFLALLAPNAPLIVNADDALLLQTVHDTPRRQPGAVIGITARASDSDSDTRAAVSVESMLTDAGGATFSLHLHEPLQRLAPAIGPLQRCVVPVVLPVLGVQQVTNAAMAATAALIAGADPRRVTEALAEVEPIRRRMHVVRSASPTIIDDTTGNPQTLRAVFATVAELPRDTLHVLFGIRGMRGPEINRRLAQSLGEMMLVQQQRTPVSLVITSSDDVADDRNRVQDDERDAMISTLQAMRVPFRYEPTLEAASHAFARNATDHDLVLLLGAQGMDRAAEFVLAALGERSARSTGRD